jgi:flagellin-like hook-associated protein FlgL
MGLRINTNIQALNAHKNLTKTDNALSSSLERLSSGLRINKAADDASGLAIADTLRAQHTGIGQAISNANDGVNIIQIADGALEESINIVNTIRTKAIQAASDAQSSASRQAIQADVDKLLEELNMIAETTAYNGINLLDGTFVDKQFHIGAYKDETAKVNIGNASGEVVGAMAYAKTDRINEAAVSDPFMKGHNVTGEALSDGDIIINGKQIDATTTHDLYYGTNAVTVENDTALAKAQAINDKINETGVQAKATTEKVLTVQAAETSVDAVINGVTVSHVNAAADMVSVINNNASLQQMGIRAEKVTGSQLRLIVEDGRNLSITTTAGSTLIEGLCIDGLGASTVHGTLTLSNARAMVGGNEAISEGTINSGDLLINGVDVAKGGALEIKDNDNDRTLINAINENEELQKLGIRAELYNSDSAGARIRLISDSQPIEISGVDPKTVSGLLKGITEGTQTTGIVLEGSPTDTNKTEDDLLRKIGFDGAMYGTSESTGVNNSGGNDESVISSAYLKTDNVTAENLSDGDIYINDVKIEATATHDLYYGTNAVTVGNDTALAKAQAINDKINETGVQAKATTEKVLTVQAGITSVDAVINGVTVSHVNTAADMISVINNNASLQQMGIKAEKVTASQLRLVVEDGRNLSITTTAGSTLIEGLCIDGLGASTVYGTLALSNARAMVTGENKIEEGNINSGELVINGVDIAAGGALTVTANDGDGTLLNAINNNEELQKLGIRAEEYNPGGGVRIRLISDKEDITISGTDSGKVSGLTSGTTEGTSTSEIKINGPLVDSDKSLDNYLRKIGLSGTRDGATEEDGVDNSGGNDILYFGKDRLQYESGDVSINGFNIGEPSDDGISHAMGDRSAAAWAEAINSVSEKTGVEADIIRAEQTGAGAVTAGVLQQGDFKINGIDIVRAETGGSGMEIKSGDADEKLVDAINEYKDQTGVIASKDADGKLVLSARDGRNIHVESTANGNKLVKFAADFGNKGVAQDSVVFGNVRLVSNEQFTVDGAGSSGSARELSLLKMGLAGGGATTDATSDMKGDGTIISGLNYDTAIGKVDVTTQEGAELAIRTADFALERLDELRSGLGSTQNQLTSTIANLSVTKINVQATESSIRDVDFAAESTTFSKMQVLMQAGTYAQSQANATSQNVMRLLQ